jgi:hypothetical protein
MTVTNGRRRRVSSVIITWLWLFRSDLFGQGITSYPSCQRADQAHHYRCDGPERLHRRAGDRRSSIGDGAYSYAV